MPKHPMKGKPPMKKHMMPAHHKAMPATPKPKAKAQKKR